MKTEQEQIEAIVEIFAKSQKRCRSINDVILQEHYADALIKAGYGDVSEYKVEIERLEAKNNELNKKNWLLEKELKKKEFEITYARNNGYEKGYDECEEYMKDKIKQAQIDVLNELKKKTHNYYPSIDSYCISQHVVLVRDIDELIKEVEEQ